MNTNKLTGAALDWAVAKCEGTLHDDGSISDYFQPSVDWEQGGAIIECEIIGLDYDATDGWQARDFDTQQITATGRTPLEAAMRCYVASKLGDDVEVPEELIDYA